MKALILNSAHTKYPLGSDVWIQASVRAVDTLAQSDVTVLCSTDPMPWSLVTYCAGRSGMNIELIVKAPGNLTGEAEFNTIVGEYDLDRTRTDPLFLDTHSEKNIRLKKSWQVRDRLAVETAQTIYPVSIRAGGRLATLIGSAPVKTKVRDDFAISWSQGGYLPRYTFEGRRVNPLPSGNWIIHWSRASQGPWPGEKAWQFYHDLLEYPDRYVRSAEATLARIIDEKLIRGSSWKLPEGERAVAFTALSLDAALPLMRWRKRFVRNTFEPFGIAVRSATLIDYGARPVQYREGETGGSHGNRLFSHVHGIRTDWSCEQEWRVRGDFPLAGIDNRDLIALVPDKIAKEALLKRIQPDIHVHAILGD